MEPKNKEKCCKHDAHLFTLRDTDKVLSVNLQSNQDTTVKE